MLPGQAAVLLQSRVGDPEQSAPPLAGAGLSQVLVCVPLPQVLLHGPQLLQPPAIAGNNTLFTTCHEILT